MSGISLGLARTLAAMDDAEFLRRVRPLSPAQWADAMRHRFRYDRGTFLKYCFPALYQRPWNRYHRDVLTRPKEPWSDRRPFNLLRADAAPRGIAKTTLLKGELVHDTVYALEDFVVVVSAEARLARAITRHLFRIFSATTGRLADLYGPFTVTGGVDAFTVTLPGGHSTGFLARSFGTQIRGANDDGPRPTKIVVDDGERPDRVRNPDQRRLWMAFLEDDILKAGPIDGGMCLEWRGTVLHADSTLANLLKNPGWQAAKYQAMESKPTPDAAALWEVCRGIFCNLSMGDLPTRHAAALAYYEANRAEMDAGVRMLDDAAFPVFAFYVEVWTTGWRSVMRDRQNDPYDPDSTLFNVDRPDEPGCIRRCRFDGRMIYPSKRSGRPAVSLNECTVGIWLDSSKGKSTSDYPAICVVARDRDGWRYWLTCDLTRRQPTAQHAALWATWERFSGAKPRVGCDATGTQGLLGEAMERIREERRRERQPWNMDLRPYEYRRDSAVDLVTEWEPALTNGWVELADDLPQEAWNQLRDFPTAAHDDALAAAERADWLLSSALPTISRAHGLGG